MKKTVLCLLLIAMSVLANAQIEVDAKNGSHCVQKFQFGAVDASCNHYISNVVTLAPGTGYVYTITDPTLWPTLPPTGSSIKAMHLMPACTSPINFSVAGPCSPSMGSGTYTCSCGTNHITFTQTSPTDIYLSFLP